MLLSTCQSACEAAWHRQAGPTCLEQLEQDVLQVGQVGPVACSQLLARPLPLCVPERLQRSSSLNRLRRLQQRRGLQAPPPPPACQAPVPCQL